MEHIYDVYTDDYSYRYGVSAKKANAILKSGGKHVMNKNEGKMMRILKKESGLTEDQIREIKKYRVMLSEAQDRGEKEKPYHHKTLRTLKKILKSCTKELKLPKEHPSVVELFKQRCEEAKTRSRYRYGYLPLTTAYANFPFENHK
jgi:hypothetical protein